MITMMLLLFYYISTIHCKSLTQLAILRSAVINLLVAKMIPHDQRSQVQHVAAKSPHYDTCVVAFIALFYHRHQVRTAISRHWFYVLWLSRGYLALNYAWQFVFVFWLRFTLSMFFKLSNCMTYMRINSKASLRMRINMVYSALDFVLLVVKLGC